MAGWHTTRWPYGMAEGKSKAYGKMAQGKMVHGKMSYVMADGKMAQGTMVHCNVSDGMAEGRIAKGKMVNGKVSDGKMVLGMIPNLLTHRYFCIHPTEHMTV